MTPDETQALAARQTEFLTLFTQWTKFIYRFLREKGFEPARMDDMLKDIQGYLWAQFDLWDPKLGAFSTWTDWQLRAWLRDRAYSIAYGHGEDGGRVQRIRRPESNAPRPKETHRLRAPHIEFTGLDPQYKPVVDKDGEHQHFTGTFTTEDPVAEMSLRLAIASLPENDRQIITMMEAGVSLKDMAAVLGLEYATLCARIKSVRKRLKGAIKLHTTPTSDYAPAISRLTYWREYFSTEIVFPEHIRKQLYAQEDNNSPQSRRT